MQTTAQFYDGVVTARTTDRGLPPAVRYDAVTVDAVVAIRLADKLPSCRITDDATEILAADIYSKCEIQVGPDSEGGKPKVRLYVKEGIPHDLCNQSLQVPPDGGGPPQFGGDGGLTALGATGFGGLGSTGGGGGPASSSGGGAP